MCILQKQGMKVIEHKQANGETWYETIVTAEFVDCDKDGKPLCNSRGDFYRIVDYSTVEWE